MLIKKIFTLTLLLVAFLGTTATAQTTPKLLKASNKEMTVEFEYNADSKIQKAIQKSMKGSEVEEQITNTFVYTADKIVQTYHNEGTGSDHDDIREATIKNGKIVQDMITSSSYNPVAYTYAYDNDNRLTLISEIDKGVVTDFRITWTGDDMTKAVVFRNNKEVGVVYFEPDLNTENPYIANLLSPVMALTSFEGIQPYAQAFGLYYGKPQRHAVKAVKYERKGEGFGWTQDDNFTIAYTKDAKGLVTKATQTDSESSEDSTFEWETITTAISGLQTIKKTANDAIYSTNGQRLQQPGKGINIIRTSDGKVKKVLVK